jgi:serine/threonine protein kinase
MSCNQCDKALSEGSRFCPECGSSVSSDSAMDEQGDLSIGHHKTMGSAPASPNRPPSDMLSIGDMPTGRYSASPKSEPPVATGIVVGGRYEVREKIGQGGFAEVYKVFDLQLKRYSAMKKLLATGRSSKLGIERFHREAVAIGGLNHRNIVTVHDFDQGQDPYIIMEYVDGGSLRDLLRSDERPSLEDGLELFRGVANGLAYAHRKKLVHRDIKPANILIDKDQGELTPKIVDFGLAQIAGSSDLSVSGYGMGTIYYMPDEQHRDAKNVDHRVDIYALGKVLYEILTGDVPNTIDQDLIPQPPIFAEVINKCTKTKPEDRYFGVDEILAALGDTVPGEATGKLKRKEAVSLDQINGCSSCGSDNPESARFCEGCGQGLVRNCPECEQETRVQVPFCASCGTDIDSYEQVRDALDKMKTQAASKHFGRVVKAFGLLPNDPKWGGKKGAGLWRDAKRLYADAVEKLERLKILEAKLKTAEDANLFGDALNAIQEIVSLSSDAEKYEVHVEQLEFYRDQSDWEDTEAAAQALLGSNSFEDAKELISTYQDTHPAGHFSSEVDALEQDIESQRLEWVWGEACLGADRFQQEGNLEKAAWVYESFLKSEPGHDQAEVAQERFSQLGEDLLRQKSFEEWDAARRDAADSVEQGKHSAALETLATFIAKDSSGPHATDAQQYLDQCQEDAARLMRGYQQQGDAGLRQGNLAEVESAVAAAKNLDAKNKIARDLTLALVKRRKRVAVLRQAATEAFTEDKWTKAVKSIQEATGLDRSDSSLANLEMKYVGTRDSRRRRLIGTWSAAIVLIMVGLFSHAANRAVWKHRFSKAVEQRDLVKAKDIAEGHLPASVSQNALDGLVQLLDLHSQVSARYESNQELFAQFETHKQTVIDDLLAKAQQPGDIQDALEDLASADESLKNFETRAASLRLIKDQVDKSYASLQIMNLSRLLPDDFSRMEQSLVNAKACTELGLAEQIFKEVLIEIGNCEPRLSALNELYSTLATAHKGNEAEIEVLRRHPLASHIREDSEMIMSGWNNVDSMLKSSFDFDSINEKTQRLTNEIRDLNVRVEAFRKSHALFHGLFNQVLASNTSRLVPDEWERMAAAAEDAKILRNLDDSLAAYKALNAQAQQLLPQLKRRHDLEMKISSANSDIKKRMADMRKHALVRHLALTLSDLKLNFQRSGKGADDPDQFEAVWPRLEACQQATLSASMSLDVASARTQTLRMIQGSLAPDLADIKTLAPEEYIRFRQILSIAERSKDIATYSGSIQDAVEQAERMSVLVDEKRRGE